MANTGDSFEIVLSQSHIAWGTYRFTNSREPISGEGYIPIPLNEARRLGLFNGNGTKCKVIWRYLCKTVCGEWRFKGIG